MHLYWPWPAKKTRQFSGEWLSCIIEKLKFPKWEASGSVATHNSAAQHSVSASDTVYGQMMSDTRGSSAGGLTNKSPNKAEEECSYIAHCHWSAEPLPQVTWSLVTVRCHEAGHPGPGSGLGPGLDPEPSQLLTPPGPHSLDSAQPRAAWNTGPGWSSVFIRGFKLDLRDCVK